MVNFLGMFLIIFLLPAQVNAASVSATVDRNQTSPGESVNLQVTLLNGQGSVDVDGIHDFKVLGRGTNTSVKIINGVTSRTVTYNYTLVPLKEGRLKIPPLPVKMDGQTLYTEEITIQVSGATKEQAARRDIFVESQVSRSNPFVGEQLTYTFRLFNAVQIANARFQPPTFDGFTSRELEQRNNYRKVINGREYAVAEVVYILVPLEAGPQKIEPAELQCDLVRTRRPANRPRSFFDDRFFGRTELEPHVLRTNALSLAVRPLPDYQGPVPFSGLVGRFKFTARIEPSTLKVGDSATLTLTLSGSGNIMDAVAPDLDLPEAFKVYTDNPEEKITVDRSGFNGRKIFRAALVPIEPGDQAVPSFHLNYFDINQERYIVLTTSPLSLTVEPGDQGERPAVVQTPQTEPESLKKRVEFTGRDILPLKQELSALKPHKAISLVWFSFMIIGPGLIFGLAKLILTRTHKPDTPRERMIKRAHTALKEAEAPNSPAHVFLNCLYRALTAGILSRAGVMSESLTWQEAQAVLIETGFTPSEASEVARLLEKIESSSYSGVLLGNAEMVSLLKETREAIRKLIK